MEPLNPKPAETQPPHGEARSRKAVQFLCDIAELTSSLRTANLLLDGFVQRCLSGICDACIVHTVGIEGNVTTAALADDLGLGDERLTALFAQDVRDFDGAISTGASTRAATLYDFRPATRSRSRDNATRLLRAAGARSLVVVPLVINAQVAGSVSFLEARRRNPYDAFDVNCAVAAVRQLSSGLEAVEARVREQDAIERSRLRARATDELFTSSDPRELLRRLLRVLTEDFADCAVAVSFDGKALEVLARSERHGSERHDDLAPQDAAFGDVSQGTVVDTLSSRRPEVISRIALAPSRVFSAPPERAEVRSWMTVPLSSTDPAPVALVCYSLRHRYTEGDLEVLDDIAGRTSVALDYARSFERERRLTRTLQQATLPSNLAPVPGAVLSAIYIPAAKEEAVGGDWYDAFSLDDHRVLLTIGDVTGHGLQASVIMGKLRHALNVVAMYESNPVDVLDIAERIVLRRYPDALATAFVAVVDTRMGKLTYANAGHPGPIVRFKDGTIRQLTPGGLPVGVRHLGPTPTREVLDLSTIDLILMYTDGLTELKRTPIEGEASLLTAVANELALVIGDCASYVKAVCLDEPSPDDVAALSINFADLRRWRFASDDHPAAHQARRDFCDALRSRGVESEDRSAAELVFGELCANVTRHAPGVAELALDLRGERAILHVVDRGYGYSMGQAAEADRLAETGRGLWLVNRLGATVSVEIVPGFGTHTRAVLPATLVSA